MKTLLLLTAYFLCQSVSHADLGWVQNTRLDIGGEENTSFKLVFKDSENYLLVRYGKTLNDVILYIDGQLHSQLSDSIINFISENSYQSTEIFDDFTFNRYVISDGNQLAIVSPETNSFELLEGEFDIARGDVQDPLKKWEGVFGDARLISYTSENWVNEQYLINIVPRFDNIERDTILVSDDPVTFGRMRDYDIDKFNEDIITYTITSDEAFLIQNVNIYKNGQSINTFDFDIPEYTDNYGYNHSVNTSIVNVSNIGQSAWMVAMKENGYFISTDNGSNWEYVNMPESNSWYGAYIIQAHNGEFLLLSETVGGYSIREMADWAQPKSELRYYDSNRMEIERPSNLLPNRFLSITPLNTYLFDHRTGWVYELENDINSVEDGDIPNTLSLSEYIRQYPNLDACIYDLNGRLIFKTNTGNAIRLINSSGLSRVLVMINGRVFKHFN